MPMFALSYGLRGVTLRCPHDSSAGKERSIASEKVQVGNDQEMAQSERNSHSANEGWEKTKMTRGYLYQDNIS